MIIDHEAQGELNLGEDARLPLLLEEKRKAEERQKRRMELGAKVCEIVEEVYAEAEKVMQNPDPSIIGEMIGERVRELLANNK